jgi:hypothetical protein
MCSVPGIPLHLHRDGRPLDNFFSPCEIIYRRFKIKNEPEDWESEGISERVFVLDRDSYNRSKYSFPEDVLLNVNALTQEEHFYDWGIVGIPYSALFARTFDVTINKVDMRFIVFLSHSPEECMYPHLEMLIYDAATNTPAPSRPRPIKMAIRSLLFENKLLIKNNR